MRCGTARTLLPLYLDGALSLGEHEKLTEHLKTCKACSSLKSLHETPLPDLPALPEPIMSRFFEELDEGLDAELALLRQCGSRQSRRGSSTTSSIPWPVTWFSGAVVGVTTSWVIFAYFPVSLFTSSERSDMMAGNDVEAAAASTQRWSTAADQQVSETDTNPEVMRSLASVDAAQSIAPADIPDSQLLRTPASAPRFSQMPVPQLYLGPSPVSYRFDQAPGPRPIPSH